MLKLFAVLLLAVVDASPVEGVLARALAKGRQEAAAKMAKTADQKQRKLDATNLCANTDSFEYSMLVAIFGDALTACLCTNTDAFAGGSSSPSSAELCKCQTELAASEYIQTLAAAEGVTGDLSEYLADQCGSGDDPCFARDTYAISPSGESIPMASLKSGDLVMDGPNSVARVIVNQHREATFKSSLLELTHANGKLSLTPDHVLEVDGAFVPARLAAAGSKLGESEVSRVTTKAGEVINPLTTSGKILTQGGVLASTYPEWVAEYMLSSYLVPLPLSLGNALSYLFPETTQAYYDALLEPLYTTLGGARASKAISTGLPAALIPAAFLVGDLAQSAGFFGFALASPMVLAAAAVAVTVAAKARK